jgi:hypothetical protein
LGKDARFFVKAEERLRKFDHIDENQSSKKYLGKFKNTLENLAFPGPDFTD